MISPAAYRRDAIRRTHAIHFAGGMHRLNRQDTMPPTKVVPLLSRKLTRIVECLIKKQSLLPPCAEKGQAFMIT
jgi:hypothetical protein